MNDDNNDKAIERAPVPMSRRGLQLNTMDDAWRFAQCCRRTAMFANKFKSDEECFLAVEMACELGVPPLMGIQHIAVISGRAFAETHLLMAAVQQAGVLTDYAEGVEQPNGTLDEDAYGWVKLTRGKGPTLETRFSIKQARSANLMGKDNWKKDPEHMLVTRALSRGLRRHFADICLGAYTVEEADEILGENHESTDRVDDLRSKLGLPPKSEPFDPDNAEGATPVPPPTPTTDAEIVARGGLMSRDEEMAAAEHVGKTTLIGQVAQDQLQEQLDQSLAVQNADPAPKKPRKKRASKPRGADEKAEAMPVANPQTPQTPVQAPPQDVQPPPSKGENVRHSHVASLLREKLGCDASEASTLRDSWLDLMGYDANSLRDDDVWAKIQSLVASADWTKLRKALAAMV